MAYPYSSARGQLLQKASEARSPSRTYPVVVAQEILQRVATCGVQVRVPRDLHVGKEPLPLGMLGIPAVDVHPVLRDEGGGIRIVHQPLDASPGRVALQRVRNPDEVHELTRCVIEDEGLVDLGPASVVFLDRVKDRCLARAVRKVIRMPVLHDARGQGGVVRLRNQLQGRGKTTDDHLARRSARTRSRFTRSAGVTAVL